MSGMFLTRGDSAIILGQSGTAVPLTGTTNETALATIAVPAGAMGIHGLIEILHVWSFTNGADDKFPVVRFSTISGTIFFRPTITTSGSGRYLTTISNTGVANAQVGGGIGNTGFISNSTDPITSAVDTTAATSIVLTGQLENSANTMTLLNYIVKLYPRA